MPKGKDPNPNRKTMSDFVGYEDYRCSKAECGAPFPSTKIWRPHGANMYKTDCSCSKTNYKKASELRPEHHLAL